MAAVENILPAEQQRSASPASFHSDSAIQYIAKAVYSFQGENTDDLRFSRGDLIAVRDCRDPNWWTGSLINTNRIGRFPACLVRVAGQYDAPGEVGTLGAGKTMVEVLNNGGDSISRESTAQLSMVSNLSGDSGNNSMVRNPSLSELNLEEILLNLAHVEVEVEEYNRNQRERTYSRMGINTPTPPSIRPDSVNGTVPVQGLNIQDSGLSRQLPVQNGFDLNVSGSTQYSEDQSTLRSPMAETTGKRTSGSDSAPPRVPTPSMSRPLTSIPNRFTAVRTPTPVPAFLDKSRSPLHLRHQSPLGSSHLAAGGSNRHSLPRTSIVDGNTPQGRRFSSDDVQRPSVDIQDSNPSPTSRISVGSSYAPRNGSSPLTVRNNVTPSSTTSQSQTSEESSIGHLDAHSLVVPESDSLCSPARNVITPSQAPVGPSSLKQSTTGNTNGSTSPTLPQSQPSSEPSPSFSADNSEEFDPSMFSQEFYPNSSLHRGFMSPSPIPVNQEIDAMSVFSQNLDYRPTVLGDTFYRSSTRADNKPGNSGSGAEFRYTSSTPLPGGAMASRPLTSCTLREKRTDSTSEATQELPELPKSDKEEIIVTDGKRTGPASPKESMTGPSREPSVSQSVLEYQSSVYPPPPSSAMSMYSTNSGRQSRLKPLPPIPKCGTAVGGSTPTEPLGRPTSTSMDPSSDSTQDFYRPAHPDTTGHSCSPTVTDDPNIFDISRIEPASDFTFRESQFQVTFVPESQPPQPIHHDSFLYDSSASHESGSFGANKTENGRPLSQPVFPQSVFADSTTGSMAPSPQPSRPLSVALANPSWAPTLSDPSTTTQPAVSYSGFAGLGPDGQPLPTADSTLPPEFGVSQLPPSGPSPFPANAAFDRKFSLLPGYATPVGFSGKITPHGFDESTTLGMPDNSMPTGFDPYQQRPTPTNLNCFQIVGGSRPVVDLGDKALNLERYNFAKVDKYSRNVRYHSTNLTPDILSKKYLTRPFQTNLEKLRAIFIWIVVNISWDRSLAPVGTRGVNQSMGGNVDPESADVVLQRRRCRLDGFASLFRAMAAAIGVDAPLISGYVRGPLDAYEGNYLPESNQSWNVLRLDSGEYRFIDCGSASLAFFKSNLDFEGTDRSTIRIDDFYFLTHPSQLVYTHYPANMGHQFLQPPVPLSSFWQLPYIRSGYFRQRVKIQNFTGARVELHDDGVLMLILRLAEGSLAYAEVEIPDQQGRVISRFPGFTQCLNYKNKRLCKVMARVKGGDVYGILKVYVGTYEDAPVSSVTPTKLKSKSSNSGMAGVRMPPPLKHRPLPSRLGHRSGRRSSSSAGIPGSTVLESNGLNDSVVSRDSKCDSGSRASFSNHGFHPPPSTITGAAVATGPGGGPVRYISASPTSLITRHSFPLAFAINIHHLGKDNAPSFARLHLTPHEFYVKGPIQAELRFGQVTDFHVLALNPDRRHMKLQLVSPSQQRTKFVYQPHDQSYALKHGIKEHGDWEIVYHIEGERWLPIVTYQCTKPFAA
ncbi:hypothetical protein IWQ61_007919 [Dispira simplex]|nr:hypothetical protein IWQ61_007919 [Dispira simplex]